MSFAVFGPGALYITRTDIPNQTPVNVGFAQEFGYDESAETKPLYGQNQYALSMARGTIKTTGKIKAAQISGVALNAVFHGLSFAAGQLLMAQSEAAAVPAATPYTVNAANVAHFDTDLGVIYASGPNAGMPLIKVASGPAQGQYSVAAGVYTFAAADANAAVALAYAYTATTGGQTLTVTNQPIGSNPTFQLDYASSLNGQSYYIRFFSCIAEKLVRAHKLTDFMMPEIDFGFFANAVGKVYEVSYAQVS